jgi:hypothetical protein
MRNTDTTNQDKGLCPLTPAAHQTAGRVLQFDSADLALIWGALQDSEWKWKEAAERAEQAGDTQAAEESRRHAAHCRRLRGRI